jgi:hypothetical protein
MIPSISSQENICVGVNYSPLEDRVSEGNLIDKALDQFKERHHFSLNQRLHNNNCFYDETYMFKAARHAWLFIEEMGKYVPHLNFLVCIGTIYYDD